MIRRPTFRHTCLWVAVLLFFTACNNNTDLPIPADKMVRIISDIHVSEYYSQGLGTNSAFKKNHDSLAVYYSSILQHHQVSYDSFMNAYVWLMQHPAIMDSIYTKALENLEALKKQYPGAEKPSGQPATGSPSAIQPDTPATNTSRKIQEAGEI